MRRLLFATIVLCVVAVACNNPVYSRATVERELQRDVHLSTSQARCLTQALEQGISPERLSAHDNPSGTERLEFRRFVRYAVIACTSTPYDEHAVAPALQRYGALDATDAACIARNAGTIMAMRADGEAALYFATAVCAAPTYDRTAATNALAGLGLSVFSRTAAACLAAKIEPIATRPTVDALRAAMTTCLAPPATTQTTSPKTTTTT
jgi:hypothetical protein